MVRFIFNINMTFHGLQNGSGRTIFSEFCTQTSGNLKVFNDREPGFFQIFFQSGKKRHAMNRLYRSFLSQPRRVVTRDNFRKYRIRSFVTIRHLRENWAVGAGPWTM